MPAPRLLPDGGTLLELRRSGKTYDEIAEMYGVTRGAVYLQLCRLPGGVHPRPSHKDLIPWRVRVEHQHAYPAMMLRLLGRRRKGEHVTDEKNRMLDSWLRELARQNLVVDYDPTRYGPNPASPHNGGWAYVARVPEDGDPDVPVRSPTLARMLRERAILELANTLVAGSRRREARRAAG